MVVGFHKLLLLFAADAKLKLSFKCYYCFIEGHNEYIRKFLLLCLFLAVSVHCIKSAPPRKRFYYADTISNPEASLDDTILTSSSCLDFLSENRLRLARSCW